MHAFSEKQMKSFLKLYFCYKLTVYMKICSIYYKTSVDVTNLYEDHLFW